MVVCIGGLIYKIDSPQIHRDTEKTRNLQNEEIEIRQSAGFYVSGPFSVPL